MLKFLQGFWLNRNGFSGNLTNLSKFASVLLLALMLDVAVVDAVCSYCVRRMNRKGLKQYEINTISYKPKSFGQIQ